MSPRPVFRGDSRDMRALEAYEQELRAWEQECEQEQLLAKEQLVKAAEARLAEERVILVKNHGATILIGRGIPDSSHGVDGQGWLDWTTLDLWLKVNGQWEVTLSLLPEVGGGPSGPAGADGVPGSSTWLGLTDTPASFSGQAGESVRVNVGETALEFFTPGAGGGFDPDDILIDELGDTIASEAGNIVLLG